MEHIVTQDFPCDYSYVDLFFLYQPIGVGNEQHNTMQTY